MKKGEIYEGKVTEVNFPNKGKVECENGTVTVKNVIPGQNIRFMINKKRSGKYEGRLLEVLEKSPLESVTDICPHFGVCGGCAYQSVSYENQLAIKEGQVKKLIDNVCSDYEFLGITGSPVTTAYRNKMEFTFGDEFKNGPLSLGLHKKNSFYDILTVTGCRNIDEDYSKILKITVDYFNEKKLPFYHKMTHEGYLRNLLVRKAYKTGEIIIDIITSTQINFDLSEYVELLKKADYKGTLNGILHTVNDSLADAVINEGTEVLYGKDYIYEELLGLKFKITPFSFFQTNSLGAEVLYTKTREFVGEIDNQVVFDLYSGTGTIAQILAPVAKKVVGVEIIEEAVVAARENARLNGLDNCEFIAGDVLKVIDDIKDKPDMIVLDPPRDGIHPKAIDKIIDFGVNKIVYVSCKPTSLARDIEIFEARGYKVKKVCCVDMFPGTGHVETVVQLVRKIPDAYIDITVDMDELDLTSSEAKATYEEIKDYIFEKFGLKVSSLNIAQVKTKCGITERENYNKPKSENTKQPQCTKDKEEAIMNALRHFKMI